MEYKLPKTTVKQVTNVFSTALKNLSDLEDLYTGVLEDNQEMAYEKPKETQMIKNSLLKIKSLKDSIRTLSVSLKKNDFSDYVKDFNAVIATVSTNDIFFILLVIMVIRSNSLKESSFSIEKDIEEELVSCLDGYHLKEGAYFKFMSLYQEYLKRGYEYVSEVYLNQLPKLNMAIQVELMKTNINLLEDTYSLYVTDKLPKKEYVRCDTPTYTEDKEIKELFKPGCEKLCDPRVLQEKLLTLGYSKSAIYSLLREMIKRISITAPETKLALVTSRVKTLPIELQKKWEDILKCYDVNSYVSFDSLMDYYYTVSGLDINCGSKDYLGYGYTDSDIDYLMSAEIDSLYKRMNGFGLERKMN